MKVVFNITLAKPTFRKRTMLQEHLICKKEEADSKAQDFILDRINDKRLIRATKFEVTYFNQNGKKMKEFTYIPTYRDDL